MAKYDIPETAFDVGDARFAIIAARFNHAVVDRLLSGAMSTLERHGVDEQHTTVVRVPGAFELPLTAQLLARDPSVGAIITLGCIIRGGTPHFEYVAAECARGIGQVALATDTPVIFGVLTTDDQQQADERAGGAHGNKGEEAALAALEMVTLRQLLDR